MSEELKLAMVRARIAFMRKPETLFLSTVCFMLKLKYDESIETGATNGTDLIIAPSFFMALSEDCRVTLLAHETFHVALQHCVIMDKYLNKTKFNYAADYVINAFLVEAGFAPIANWLYDPQYKGMSTQQVYALLPDDPEKLQKLTGVPIDVHLGPEGTKPDGEAMTPIEVQQEIVNILNTAAEVAQRGGQPGSIPGDVEVFLDKLSKPILPLSQMLRKFFTAVAKNDYTWKKFNRRLFPMLMPALSGNKLTEIAFAYDMSGSVRDKDTNRYQSELVGVLRFLRPDVLRLVQFDTCIRHDDRIRSLAELSRVKLCGRGGTDIDPLMEWAAKHKPTALVVFTDGEYCHPAINPGIPVLWVVHGRRKEQFSCDFGTVIRFDT